MKISLNRVLVYLSVSLTVLGGVISFQFCSDVKLHRIDKASVRTQGIGEICLKGPSNLENPQRIIFFLDQSESMQGIDPASANPLTKAKRVDALRELIDFYKAEDNFYISFGFVMDRTAGFLSHTEGLNGVGGQACPTQLFYHPRNQDDYVKIQTILDNQDILSQRASGGTSFSDFLVGAKDCISADMAIHPDSSYNVVLVTDGQDNYSSMDTLRTLVQQLITLGKVSGQKLSQANLFFYLINKDPDVISYMVSLLNEARNIGGYLSEVYPYIEDDLSKLNYLEMRIFNRKKYRIQRFFATNMNAAVSDLDGFIMADSDGDGLADEDELNPPYGRLATSPRHFSTQFSVKSQDLKSQCSDKVFVKYGFCPGSCFSGEALADTDSDGVSNCDESSEYHTEKANLESDGDGIFDGLEVRIGSSPSEKDDTADASGDGIDNYHKALSQISSKFNNRGVKHRYLTRTEFNFTRELQNMNCYHLSVSDLPLFNTISVLGNDTTSNTLTELRHDSGGNAIKFLIYMVPENEPNSNPEILVSRKPLLLYYQDFGEYVRSFTSLSERDFRLYEK